MVANSGTHRVHWQDPRTGAWLCGDPAPMDVISQWEERVGVDMPGLVYEIRPVAEEAAS